MTRSFDILLAFGNAAAAAYGIDTGGETWLIAVNAAVAGFIAGKLAFQRGGAG